MAEDSTVHLHIPALEELWFRQEMLEDPETMSYNRGYDLQIPCYDPKTGCIAFPPENWQTWYDRWIGTLPDRFYAYIVRSEDGAFLGEANLYRSDSPGIYEMGIVLASRYRGLGYAAPALNQLLSVAFERLHAEAVHNCFEPERAAALHLHLAAGFQVQGNEGDCLDLVLRPQDFHL